MTFQPMEPPRQADFKTTGASKKKRGCAIGCLIGLVVLVLIAAFIGIEAKKAFDSITGKDDNPATQVTTAPNAKQVTAAEYGQAVAQYGTPLSTDVAAVSSKCKSVATNKSACQAAVQTLHIELQQAQTALSGIVAPPSLKDSDAKLRDAVSDGLTGTANVDKGLDNHPIALAQGLVQVGKSATELRQAESSLNNELATMTTTAK